MSILAISIMDSGDTDASQEPSVNPLESGFIDEGVPSHQPGRPTWCDSSEGEYYGGGNRYAHEETPFMAKVPSKHR